MPGDQYGAVLTLPSGNPAPDSDNSIADELDDIEGALTAAAIWRRQMPQNLHQQLQHWHLDQLDDPFAVTADVGDQTGIFGQARPLSVP
ncbi:MAG: hypothetical protein WC054_07080 [Candidatus Nanopelagicales bacterium]